MHLGQKQKNIFNNHFNKHNYCMKNKCAPPSGAVHTWQSDREM